MCRQAGMWAKDRRAGWAGGQRLARRAGKKCKGFLSVFLLFSVVVFFVLGLVPPPEGASRGVRPCGAQGFVVVFCWCFFLLWAGSGLQGHLSGAPD